MNDFLPGPVIAIMYFFLDEIKIADQPHHKYSCDLGFTSNNGRCSEEGRRKGRFCAKEENR